MPAALATAALWFAVLLALALLLHGAAFAVEMVCVAAQHRDDPAPRPSASQLLRAVAREALLALRVFGWRQVWRRNAVADDFERPGYAGRRGVLLVHGHLCNRAFWQPWQRALSAAGVPHRAISLTPTWADIDRHAPQMEAAVAQMLRATGRTPLLVGHSMGGLVIRAWWRWRTQRLAAAESVKGSGSGVAGETADGAVPLALIEMPAVLTLGTPHQGTWLASWARALPASQMRPGNDWLANLAASESADWRARFGCVHSHCDNVVFPPARAVLPGAGQVLHWAGLAHLELGHDPRGWQLALQQLERLDQPDHPRGAVPASA
ncbi:MAG: esterase/lipase family protein [Leptothrix sp. (in: b-proteobacteria)]